MTPHRHIWTQLLNIYTCVKKFEYFSHSSYNNWDAFYYANFVSIYMKDSPIVVFGLVGISYGQDWKKVDVILVNRFSLI